MRQPHLDLSRRERQIIAIIYKQGHATAAEVQLALPDPPSYSAVRAMLRFSKRKAISATSRTARAMSLPTVAPDRAKKTALKHMLQTFFDDRSNRRCQRCSTIRSTPSLGSQLDRLAKVIDRARRSGA